MKKGVIVCLSLGVFFSFILFLGNVGAVLYSGSDSSGSFLGSYTREVFTPNVPKNLNGDWFLVSDKFFTIWSSGAEDGCYGNYYLPDGNQLYNNIAPNLQCSSATTVERFTRYKSSTSCSGSECSPRCGWNDVNSYQQIDILTCPTNFQCKEISDGEVWCVKSFTCTTEICDGIDNDCDGTVDEGTLTCGTGQCFKIIPMCNNGYLQTCYPEGGASIEICDNIDNDCDHETDENPTSICIAGSTCTSGTCIVNSALTSALWKDSTGTTTISSAYAGTNVMLAVSGIGFTGKTITYKIYNGNSLINTTSKLSSSDTSASLVWMVESNGTYTFNASLSSTSLIIHSGALTSPSERNVTGACNGSLLINATWNDNKTSGAGTYTYTQKWNISASIWQPVIVLNTEYNETIGDCNFKCPSEYLWDGTNCVQNIINNLYCTNFGTQSQCEDESNSAVSAAAKLTLDDNGEYCGAQNILDPNNLASTCYYNVNCNCVWDGTSCNGADADWNYIEGTCSSGYSGNPGICSTSVKILEDNCNNPKNNRIIQVVATWTGNAYPINCNNQTVTYPCMSTATLSFFGVTQMIIGIFVVALIYLSYSFIRSKKQGI